MANLGVLILALMLFAPIVLTHLLVWGIAFASPKFALRANGVVLKVVRAIYAVCPGTLAVTFTEQTEKNIAYNTAMLLDLS